MELERTLVLLKPETIQRRLIGTIIARFEQAGLDVEQLKILKPTEDIVTRHYPEDEEWLKTAGSKSLETYRKYGIDPIKQLGTDDPLTIGKMVKSRLVQHLTSGKVVAMVLGGMHAIDVVRKLTGYTVPLIAEPGTIRGDFSNDSPYFANREMRPVYNLVHASGTLEEAAREIALWFGEKI